MAERIPKGVTIRVPLQAYQFSDHVSPATGKTIAITISKNGAAYANPSAGSTNATEIASGSYYVDLSTTDIGTVGPLMVKGTEASIDTIIAIYDVYQPGEYSQGSVWLDTVTGSAGTTAFVNGLDLNPANSLANALTIAALSGISLKSFHIGQGNSITFGSSLSSQRFWGDQWTLALGGQPVLNCTIEGASVSGTSDTLYGGNIYSSCTIGNVTTNAGVSFQGCQLTGTITLSATGTLILDGCTDACGLGARPIIDMGASVGATEVRISAYSGDIEIQNLKTGDEVDVQGTGLVVLNANCTGGTLKYSGMALTNNATGVTVSTIPAEANATQWAGTTINSLSLPVASTAGGSGGVLIAGSNAATTFASVTCTGAFTINGNLLVSGASTFAGTITCSGGISTDITGNRTGNLSGSVGSVTGAVGSVTGNVGGNVTGSVGSVVGAVGSVTGAVGSVTGAVGSVTGNVGGNVVGSVASVAGAVGSVTGNVGGNVVGSVASVTGAVGSVTGNVGGNVTGSVGSVASGGITAASFAAGTLRMPKNTAFTGFEFPMFLTGTNTPAPGKTITATKSIAGVVTACDNAATENLSMTGVYKIDFSANDRNGNSIIYYFTASGCDPQIFTILSEG